jgi:hypothetical protein
MRTKGQGITVSFAGDRCSLEPPENPGIILLASEIMVLLGIMMSFRFTPHYSITAVISKH